MSERSVEIERQVAASPDAVWKALTDAEELRRWFPLDADVDPGEGGSIWLSWGPGCEGRAPIRTWEPGRRFGWVEEGGTAEAPVHMAVDFHLEPDDGGTVVRLVHSGFGSDADWDEYFDAVRDGWTYFMYNLAHYLERHGGKARTLAWVRRSAGRARIEVWEELAGDAGAVPLPGGDPRAGAPVRVRLGDLEARGTVVYGRAHRCLAVRLPELDEALLFVELECCGDEGWHCGIWLSSWEPSSEEVRERQAAAEALAGRILA